jgi:hypothetical protein
MESKPHGIIDRNNKVPAEGLPHDHAPIATLD